MYRGLEDVDALLVIAHEATPSSEKSNGSLDHPASRQHLEALFSRDPSDDFDDELQERGLVHELGTFICPVSDEIVFPRPALADGIEVAWTVALSEIMDGGQIDHQQAFVGIYRHVRSSCPPSKPRLAPCDEAFTVWLARTLPSGLASPPQRSRFIISAKSWMVRININRTKRRSHQ